MKQMKNKVYIEELNKMVEKRNILFKELKSIDINDGTVKSYKYDPYMQNMRNRLSSLEGRVRSLKKKVERTS